MELADISNLFNLQFIKEFLDISGDDTLLLAEIIIRTMMGTVFDNEAGQADQIIIILNVTFHTPTFPDVERFFQVFCTKLSQHFQVMLWWGPVYAQSPQVVVQKHLEMMVGSAH